MMQLGGRRAGGSLAFSFMLVILIVFAVGQGTAWVWFLFMQKNHNQQMVKEKIETMAKLLSDITAQDIVDKDYDLVQSHAEGILKAEEIISVTILDERGDAIVRLSSGEGSMLKGKSVNPLYVPWRNSYEYQIEKDDNTLGTIVIGYSGKKINDVMYNLMTFPPLIEGLVFLAVTFSIYLFFQNQIGVPIKTIQNCLERIASGDLTVGMPNVGKNELGGIAKGMEFLVERLSSTVQKLNNASDVVVNSIEELDGTFDRITNRARMQTASTEKMAMSLMRANESVRKIMESTGMLSEVSSENASSLLEIKATGDEIVTSMDSLFQAAEKSFITGVEMSRSSGEMADIVKEVSESVENTSASVEEIVASVREVEKSAIDSSQLAENVKEEASQRGIVTVAEVVTGMEKITEKVMYSANLVKQLDKRSKDVQKVLAVIKEVTEQTNLLSLNAAILAEKAGEYGKGFSVVADEMRALSNRTADYTKDISNSINAIQFEIKEIVASIETSMEMVRQGSETVYKAGETMSAILESSFKSANMTRSIEMATKEQANSLDYISASIVGISDKATMMSKTMNEQLKNAGVIMERISEVREIVEATKKSTEEQARGTTSISRNFEHASLRIEDINDAVSNQKRVNDGIIYSVEDIRKEEESIVGDMEEVTVLLNKLQKECEALRKESGKFKLG